MSTFHHHHHQQHLFTQKQRDKQNIE